jgi:hypothetical protein
MKTGGSLKTWSLCLRQGCLLHANYTDIIFSTAIQEGNTFFSGNTASIAAIIPAMDRLHNTLNLQMKKEYHPSILVAMIFTQKKLNQYYSKTNLLSVYRIAMGNVMASNYWCLLIIYFIVLHPGLKLEYFWQHGWEDEWIDMAKNLVHKEYAVNYQIKENGLGNDNTEEQRNQVSTI